MMKYSWPEHFQPLVVREAYGSGILSSYCIALEAWRRGLRVTIKHPRLARYEISDGTRQIAFYCSRPTTLTNPDAIRLTHDKYETTEALRAAGVACPQSIPFESEQSTFAQIAQAAQQVGYPVVIKPRNGSQGKGVLAGIMDEEELRAGYEWLTEDFKAREFVLEKFFEGGDHRVLVVGDKAVAAGVKAPAHVVGDGRHTIVGSARGAVAALLLLRFPGPPAEPGVRFSPHRALHVRLLVRHDRLSVSTGSGCGNRGSGTG